jgi:transposase
VVLQRCAGELGRVRRLGEARFIAAVRRELPRWGATRPCLRIVRGVFAALADPAGVAAHRPGVLERVHLAMSDWHDTRARFADADSRMARVMDDLGLTSLVTTIAGLTPADVAAILAETGDPPARTTGWPASRPAPPAPPPCCAGATSSSPAG